MTRSVRMAELLEGMRTVVRSSLRAIQNADTPVLREQYRFGKLTERPNFYESMQDAFSTETAGFEDQSGHGSMMKERATAENAVSAGVSVVGTRTETNSKSVAPAPWRSLGSHQAGNLETAGSNPVGAGSGIPESRTPASQLRGSQHDRSVLAGRNPVAGEEADGAGASDAAVQPENALLGVDAGSTPADSTTRSSRDRTITTTRCKACGQTVEVRYPYTNSTHTIALEDHEVPPEQRKPWHETWYRQRCEHAGLVIWSDNHICELYRDVAVALGKA